MPLLQVVFQHVGKPARTAAIHSAGLFAGCGLRLSLRYNLYPPKANTLIKLSDKRTDQWDIGRLKAIRAHSLQALPTGVILRSAEKRQIHLS